MTATLIENEDFSLVYSSDTRIFHYFIFRKKNITSKNVIDATGLVWRCTIFLSSRCKQFFNEIETENALTMIKNMRLLGHSSAH